MIRLNKHSLKKHFLQRPWLFWLVPTLALAGFGLDRWIKWYVIHHPEAFFSVLGDWLYFAGYINTDMAFSLPLITWVYYPLVTIVMAVLLFVGYRAARHGQWADGGIILFIFAGAISNMLDRFLYHGVVDYITVSFWSVFNLADIFIVVAIGVWFIRLWMQDRAERAPQ